LKPDKNIMSKLRVGTGLFSGVVSGHHPFEDVTYSI